MSRKSSIASAYKSLYQTTTANDDSFTVSVCIWQPPELNDI